MDAYLLKKVREKTQTCGWCSFIATQSESEINRWTGIHYCEFCGGYKLFDSRIGIEGMAKKAMRPQPFDGSEE
jgi:hypothetical protein